VPYRQESGTAGKASECIAGRRVEQRAKLSSAIRTARQAPSYHTEGNARAPLELFHQRPHILQRAMKKPHSNCSTSAFISYRGQCKNPTRTVPPAPSYLTEGNAKAQFELFDKRLHILQRAMQEPHSNCSTSAFISYGVQCKSPTRTVLPAPSYLTEDNARAPLELFDKRPNILQRTIQEPISNCCTSALISYRGQCKSPTRTVLPAPSYLTEGNTRAHLELLHQRPHILQRTMQEPHPNRSTSALISYSRRQEVDTTNASFCGNRLPRTFPLCRRSAQALLIKYSASWLYSGVFRSARFCPTLRKVSVIIPSEKESETFTCTGLCFFG
jgi:hypothetical protein